MPKTYEDVRDERMEELLDQSNFSLSHDVLPVDSSSKVSELPSHAWRVDRTRHNIGSVTVQGGKKYYTYREVLDYAHANGFVGFRQLHPPILTTVKYPKQVEELPIAICSVEAVFFSLEHGFETYHGTGDATSDNCSPGVAKHLVRMADTRAKARALGDALNLDANFIEEFEDTPAAKATGAMVSPASAPKTAEPTLATDATCEGCGAAVKPSRAALSKVRNKGRVLCLTCEKRTAP
jgi:hypothetical protein